MQRRDLLTMGVGTVPAAGVCPNLSEAQAGGEGAVRDVEILLKSAEGRSPRAGVRVHLFQELDP